VGQWLPTREVLAAANTNKKLTSWGIFVPTGSGSTIVMVNGGLMAKTTLEPFQQVIKSFHCQGPFPCRSLAPVN
jgi:hypothetical protein